MLIITFADWLQLSGVEIPLSDSNAFYVVVVIAQQLFSYRQLSRLLSMSHKQLGLIVCYY